MGSRLDKNSADVRKRIEGHEFHDEEGEEYQGSKFGGFTDYMRRKKIKLQNLDAQLRTQSKDNLQIFRGVVCHVNGYTQPSLNDLHKLIVSHGGGFLQYLDGKTAVTHVIASSLTPKKKVEFARYRIVKPAWIVDSVKAGRLLPWDSYRVVDEGMTQKVLGFENGNIVSQANSQRQGYRDQTDTSWYTSQVRQAASELDMGVDEPPPSAQPLSHAGAFADEPVSDVAEDQDPGLEDADVDYEPEQSADVRVPAQESAQSHATHDGPEIGQGREILATRLEQDPETLRYSIVPDDTASTKQSNAEKHTLTAEEHNAVLLSNPHLAKSSTANPDFLNQYYRESRLHHLSTWKAELKAQLQARTQEQASQKTRHKRAPGARRYIMHVDFDSFFAAVSLRKHPQLVEKPVVIAHGSGPGSEIASCNYPARKFGVKNGMWMKSALEMCPDLKVLPYDFKAYEEASKHFYDSILAMDGVVQSISIDEALVDVSVQCIQAGGSDGKAITEGSIYREQAKANQLADELRLSVKDKTGCDVSVGIGNNILLAKVALRKAKPAGQYLIKPEDMLDIIGELQVTSLPGVAWSLGNKLEELGVKFVKDIRGLTKERLMNALGPKTGEKLWEYSRGIDKVEVGDGVVRKSVSAEVNWGIRFITRQQAEEFVQCLCDELSKRLLENTVKGRQMTMKIMRKAADAPIDPPKNLGHGKCDTFNKSVVLGVATYDSKILGKEAISILRSYGFSPGELRGLGVQMQKLEPLKPVNTADAAPVDSSQRRLQFKKPDFPTAKQTRPLLNESDVATSMVSDSAIPPRDRFNADQESIEEVPTPEKKSLMQTIKGALHETLEDQDDKDNHKPLNVSGTQFIIPTQVDPKVLAELPPDIRAKLAPKQKSILDTIKSAGYPQSEDRSRSESPYLSDGDIVLPNHSQLDPETLSELPDDVRAELLAHYQAVQKADQRRYQQVLPQSPRKNRPVLSKKVTLTPTKKHKISTVLGRSRYKPCGSSSTLTQSNFVSVPKQSAPVEDGHDDIDAAEDISQSFLDELPEDIRLEILAEQKRNRMRTKFGLNLNANKRKSKAANLAEAERVRGQQTLQLPPLPEKPTFTSRKLSTLPELREAMTGWVTEFSNASEEGPFEEDADALKSYLQKVVLDERDIAKAVGVVEWLSYVINDCDFEAEQVRNAWNKIVLLLKSGLQDSVQARGLPAIAFK